MILTFFVLRLHSVIQQNNFFLQIANVSFRCSFVLERPNLIEKSQVLELRNTLLKVKKVYSRLVRSQRKTSKKKKSDRISAVLAAVNQLGKQHADLMNFYRNQPDKLTVSPVIREVFDLHPTKAYKEKWYYFLFFLLTSKLFPSFIFPILWRVYITDKYLCFVYILGYLTCMHHHMLLLYPRKEFSILKV